MNVITFASRKGGAGKSTLTAHVAAFAHRLGHRCLMVDADPQGSLTLWHSLRAPGQLPLQTAARGIDGLVASAMVEGYEWVFIDTSPTMWVVVHEAIRAATLVAIPARPGFFDVAAVCETVAIAQKHRRPYAVLINAAPVKRDGKEAPAVTLSRSKLGNLAIPVWSGQITQRASYMASLAAGGSATETDPDSSAADEIMRLWRAIERSVDVVNSRRGEGVGQSHAA